MAKSFTNIEKLVRATSKLERALGEFGETPYAPLKEEQEKKSFGDHDGKVGHHFEQHTHQFFLRECAQS